MLCFSFWRKVEPAFTEQGVLTNALSRPAAEWLVALHEVNSYHKQWQAETAPGSDSSGDLGLRPGGPPGPTALFGPLSLEFV